MSQLHRRLRSSHLANCGARLAGVAPHSPTREPDSQAPHPGGSRASPDAPQASGETFALTLTPSIQAILLLASKAAGTSPAEFVKRSIVAHAREAVGFPALCDELFDAPDPVRIGDSRFKTDHAGVPP